MAAAPAERDDTPAAVIALPLSHRPLLPGMTIQLQIHGALYNKLVTDLHMNKHSLVGAFLMQDRTMPPVVAKPPASRKVAINGRPIYALPKIRVPQTIDRVLMASQFIDIPHINDIHKVGTLCKVVQLTQDRSLMIESLRLIKASSMADRSLLTVNVNGRPDDIITDWDLAHQLKCAIVEAARHMIDRKHMYEAHLRVVVERATADLNGTDLSLLVNQVGGLCTSMSPSQEQVLLEQADPLKRAALLLHCMAL
ncbi:hypothetical protein PBRA_009299 [Plasmodiophora brassicae]|nr:hypothetical protein PBRA_009299 [Plasmodiophora brassicae]